MTDQAIAFGGFRSPDKNFSELPHELILLLPLFKTLAEMKVVLYILRHTWGFHEYDEPKQITLDEFEHGRKNRKGKRIDSGVGMVKNSILDGLQRAVEHGFIEVETDDSDKARIGKSYMLRMFKSCTSDGQALNPGIPEVEHRTEKPTLETNQEINKTLADEKLSAQPEAIASTEPISEKAALTLEPITVTAFKDALEPKEKGSGEKEKVYTPPAGYERRFITRQVDLDSLSHVEHLVSVDTSDPQPTCKRCGQKLSDGTTVFPPPADRVFVRCKGKEPKPRKARDAPVTYTAEVKNALAELCKQDWTIKANAGAMGRTLKQLDGKITVALIARFKANWYRCDFRGKKGQAPKPHQVVDCWTELTESDECKDDGRKATASTRDNRRDEGLLAEGERDPGEVEYERKNARIAAKVRQM